MTELGTTRGMIERRCRILKVLDEAEDKLIRHRIAERVGHNASTIGRDIKEMEEDGYVTYDLVPNGVAAVRNGYYLTDRGKEALAKCDVGSA